MLGGEVAMGMALDFRVSQYQGQTVTDFEEFDQAVRSDWSRFYYSEADLEFEYSTRLGLQWRGQDALINAFVPSVGVVITDVIGSESGFEKPARFQGGLALNGCRRGVPTLALDYGSLELIPGYWQDGFALGLVEHFGALRFGLGVGDLGHRASASLNLSFMRLDYLYTSVKDDLALDLLGQPVHAFRVAIGPFGKPKVAPPDSEPKQKEGGNE
jgi:hypothetical protein